MTVEFVVVLASLAATAVLVWVALRGDSRSEHAALRHRAAVMASVGWSPALPDPWLVSIARLLYVPGRPTQMFTGDFRGRRLFVIDYEFTSDTGPGSAYLVALMLPAALPPLTVTEEVRLESMLGQDIELESQAFNDRYRVQGYTRQFASAVLQPRVMEWMLQNPGLYLHVGGNMLMTWGHRELTTSEILARLEAIAGVIDRIPPFVFRDYGMAR